MSHRWSWGFGTWLSAHYREVGSCADLERFHIEEFKTWLTSTPSARTGKPLARSTIKEHLNDLGCFFDRITNWGYPDAPTSPLIFSGDLPRLDRPRWQNRNEIHDPSRPESRGGDRMDLTVATDLGGDVGAMHDLRHSHAAWLIAAGEHPKAIQTRLGQESPLMWWALE